MSAQNRYSLLDRDVEDELVPACERFGLGMLPFFPLEYGLLTGKYRRGEAAPTGSRADLDASRAGWLAKADWDRIEALEAYAAERGLSVLDVAIAGLAAQPTVASVISGVTRGEQVSTNASALRWEPTEDDLDELDASELDASSIVAQARSYDASRQPRTTPTRCSTASPTGTSVRSPERRSLTSTLPSTRPRPTVTIVGTPISSASLNFTPGLTFGRSS